MYDIKSSDTPVLRPTPREEVYRRENSLEHACQFCLVILRTAYSSLPRDGILCNCVLKYAAKHLLRIILKLLINLDQLLVFIGSEIND